MVDLSKKEINEEINEEINNEVNKTEINQVALNKEEVNQEIPAREINQMVNNEINNQVNNREVNQVVLDKKVVNKEIPTREINQTVNNTNLNKTVIDKQYGTFELIGLTFKLIHKNIGKFLMCLLKVSLVAIVLITPVLLTLDNGNIDNVATIFSIVIMVMFYFFLVSWFVIRAVTSIDTGIETIELKKTNVPIGTTFWRILGIWLVVFLLVFATNFLVRLTSSAVFIYAWLMLQMQIFNFLFNNYSRFSYFEIMTKGKNVSNSLSNAFTNLFFSKNNVIIKLFTGSLIIGLASFGIIFAIVFFGLLVVAAFFGIQSVALGSIITVILVIIFVLIICYLSFFSETYKYLVYMLNEVRDDKVDDLR